MLLKHHKAWLAQHQAAYQNGLINSHSLTADLALSESDHTVLFQTIASVKLMAQVATIFPKPPRFLNTQLFFDPYHSDQRNFWHRDVQYTGLNEAAQRAVILQQNVVHCRIAMRPEHGIELIAGSHQRWDSEQEYAVRMGKPPFTGRMMICLMPHKLLYKQAIYCCFQRTCCIDVCMAKTVWRLTSFTATTIPICLRIAVTTPCPIPAN